MNNWIMRMPEPMPLGLIFLLAMILATVGASLVKVPAGGKVETVFTLCDHFFLLAIDGPCRSFNSRAGDRQSSPEGSQKVFTATADGDDLADGVDFSG